MAENFGEFLHREVYPRLTAEAVYTWAGHNWQRSASKWRGCCPWHESRSGTSFDVSLPSLLWFCQGCGIGGGPLEYQWRLQGGMGPLRSDNFVRLARELAEIAGVPFPERDLTPGERAQAEQRASRAAALEMVYRHCVEVLWRDAGGAAREYLHSRGLSDEAIHNLELGLYDDTDAVRKRLLTARYATTPNEGACDGLVGYITFPWRDDAGRPLTIYGRWPAKAPPDGKPKTYAQPGEGSKCSPLYFDRVLHHGHNNVVLVEGVLDAAVLQTLGQTDVAAYVGGQPSLAQLETLKWHKIATATICPDPDAGGDSGVLSFLRNVDPAIRAYVAPRLPDGLDPDEFIIAHGVRGWQEQIAHAVAGWHYMAQRAMDAHDLTSQRGRDDALAAIAQIAGTLTQEREIEELTRLAARPLGVSQKALAGDLRQAHKEALARRAAEAQRRREEIAVRAQATEPALEPKTLDQVLKVYQKWLFSDDTGDIEVVLAAVVANRSPGDPVWLLVIAPPGGGKTERIMPLAALPDVHLAATLTEASLLSGTASKEVADDATGGLLRQVGEQGIILIKDLSGLLSLNRDTRGPVLSALREVYDGQWARPVGTDGGRVLEWKGKCGLIGGATPAIDSFHATIAALGERFTFYRLSEEERDKRTKRSLQNASQEGAMRAELANVVKGFFAGLPAAPVLTELTEEQETWLIKLSDLVVRARSGVERDAFSPSREILNVWGAEMPTRFVKVLAQLRKALLHIGVSEERMWIHLRRVGMDSIPRTRHKVLAHLGNPKQPTPQATREIALQIKLPTKSVERALEELQVYDLVDRTGPENKNLWSLSDLARGEYVLTQEIPCKPQTREGGDCVRAPSLIPVESVKTPDTSQPELRAYESDHGNGGLPDSYTGRATWLECMLPVTVTGLAEPAAGKRFFHVAETQAAISEDDLKIEVDA